MYYVKYGKKNKSRLWFLASMKKTLLAIGLVSLVFVMPFVGAAVVYPEAQGALLALAAFLVVCAGILWAITKFFPKSWVAKKVDENWDYLVDGLAQLLGTL